jgi:excisionase family DNA binding protein
MSKKGAQPELRFVTNFPTEQTLQLLLDAHTLFIELKEEKQRQSMISLEEASDLLELPSKKIQQLVEDGHLKQLSDGRLYRYHVIRILFELKQAELFESIG